MFFRVGRHLIQLRVGLRPPLRWEVEMALVESFALHTRVLADFFFKDKTRANKKTDARAWDYFPTREAWKKVAGDLPLWLSKVQNPDHNYGDKFGRELAHLGFHEASLSERAGGWPVAQINTELGRVVHAFVDHVDDAKVARHFKTALRREIPLAAVLGAGPHALGIGTRPETTRPLAYD